MGFQPERTCEKCKACGICGNKRNAKFCRKFVPIPPPPPPKATSSVQRKKSDEEPCRYRDTCIGACDWCESHDYSEACVPMLQAEIKREKTKFDSSASTLPQYMFDMAMRGEKEIRLHWNHKGDKSEVLYKRVDTLPKVLYLCDRQKCADCSYPVCKHTEDITHAKNFKRIGVGTPIVYVEKEN